MRSLAKIGDIFTVPICNGRFAYVRFIYRHPMYSAMVEVKSTVDAGGASVDEVLASPRLFPPVFVGLNVPVRRKMWTKIGASVVEEFEFPIFRLTNGLLHDDVPGEYDDWSLWNGEQYTFIGALPPELRKLEFLVVWGALVLADRIASGTNPYDLMV